MLLNGRSGILFKTFNISLFWSCYKLVFPELDVCPKLEPTYNLAWVRLFSKSWVSVTIKLITSFISSSLDLNLYSLRLSYLISIPLTFIYLIISISVKVFCCRKELNGFLNASFIEVFSGLSLFLSFCPKNLFRNEFVFKGWWNNLEWQYLNAEFCRV